MIDSGYFWFSIFCLTVGTLIIRGTLIFLSSRFTISERVKDLFSFIPAALLPAFILPAAFFHQGKVEALFGKERLLVQSIDQRLCIERKQLDHPRQCIVRALWRIRRVVPTPHITKTPLDRPHRIGAHSPHADHHRGVDGRSIKMRIGIHWIHWLY